MAFILELVKSDISLNDVHTWLINGAIHKDLEELLKNEASTTRYRFPVLLADFIRDQASKILKLHNVRPHELATATSPRKEIVLPSVSNLSLLSPSPNSKHAFQGTRRIRKVTPQPLDLQSDSAFPSLLQSNPTREVPKKRRINPTQLLESPVGNRSPLQLGSKSSPPVLGNAFYQAKEQVGHKNLDQERALLKEKKQQLDIPTTPDLSSNLVKSWPCLEPDQSCVTQQIHLNRLSALVSFCLSRHLIPTLYKEVEFLVQLLVIRVSPARLDLAHLGCSLFDSVHNCVYFAAHTLESLDGIWDYLDQSLQQQLLENQRLLAFSPKWISGRLAQLSVSTRIESKIALPKTVPNVAFQLDTDNRFNFASDQSFQTFRKQRDQFCEIWQIWKVNSASPNWNTVAALKRMVQSLVDMRRDCVNYAHLARLFRSQLLNVAQLVEPVNDEKERDGPLGQLQSSDPDKLRRLKERLVNPPESRATRITVEHDIHSAFEGDQEFFREFILLAESPAFNEHLKNSLVDGIEELSRSEDCDKTVQFAETVIALQVMAKFLAFLNFYPYTSGDHFPEHVFHQLSHLRRGQREPIDLLMYIEEAFHKGRLILIVPWVVTYLTLADPVSFSLPGFQSALCYLVYLYRKAELAPGNSFFVRILLSWLFDQPNFPRPLLVKSNDELLVEFRSHSIAEDTLPKLDQCLLLDSSLIHQCCPFLWSWKHLLTDFACSDAKRSGKKALVSRKITPISAEESPSPVKTPAIKSLQQTLEENFFHNQPSSVKRTVEFVAERLASNIVRDVRHQLIPRLVLNAQATLNSWAKVDNQQRLEALCRDLCVDVRKEAVSLAISATASLDTTLVALLPNDLLPQVKKICVTIASRLTHEKVDDWINLHVTVGLFKNDLGVELAKLEKIPPQITPVATTIVKPSVVHDPNTLAPSILIDQLKTSIRQVIRDASKVTDKDLTNLLSQVEGTLLRRIDVIPAVFKCLQQLTFDFLFIMCVFQPESVGSSAISAWVDFWCRTYPNCDPISQAGGEPPGALISASVWQVLTPKQLLLLAQSTSPRESWNHVSILLIQLMKSGLVRYKDVQEQAVAVVRQEWPRELLARFATLARDIVDWHRNNPDKNENLSSETSGSTDNDDGLLSWLSWFCSQDDL